MPDLAAPVRLAARCLGPSCERHEGTKLPYVNTGAGLVGACFLYSLAAVVLFFQRGLGTGTTYLGGGTDPSLYIWMFQFLPDALVHLHNPLLLAPAWAPTGLNITQATTTPGLALMAWPITAVVGPVVAFNIVSMAAPALAATSAFLFASAFTERWGAALVSGWLFGFSTYVFAALLGHLQVDFVAFVPLAFLAVVQRSRRRIRLISYVVWLVLVLVAQFLTSLETFATMGLFLFLFTAVAEASCSGGIGRVLRLRRGNLLLGLMAAGMLAAVIMSPFMAAFFKDYTRIPLEQGNSGYWSLDLLDFVVPTPVTWIGGRLALPIARHFTGNWSEDLGYVGLPLLSIIVLAAWNRRRERLAWPLIVLFVVGAVCTLGPHLHVFGRRVFDLPWIYIGRLPLLSNAQPGRLMVFVLLAMSGLAALWIERLPRGQLGATLLLAGAAMFTLPASISHRHGWWDSPVPKAKLFTSGRYRSLIPRGSTVLFLPFGPASGNVMFWQTETRGYFHMVNGYGDFVPPSLSVWPASEMLEAGTPGPSFAVQFDRFAKALEISRVVVPHRRMAVWASPLRQAGWRGTTVGRMTVFAWSSAQRATTAAGSGIEARASFDRAHLAALHHAATCLADRNAVRIDPKAAVSAHCLAPAFGPPTGKPNDNWDRMHGWLGRFGSNIAIGLNTIGPVARLIAQEAGPKVARIYYPYPKRYHPGRKRISSKGELLEILSLN